MDGNRSDDRSDFFFGFKRNLAEPVEKDDFWRHVEYTRN